MPDRDNLKAGERRVATILFSDMKGSTSLSERMDPEEMDALMNRVFGLFEEIIKAHGGIVEKYIGDALVAVFGVPELHEDDPSRAIHSALEFRSRLESERGRLGPDGKAVAFRTGVHTGLVTTGRRGEFDVVTGHAMSVAQRLEAAAEPGTVLVSEAVKEKCEADFDFSAQRWIEAKGKTDRVSAYEVRGESSGGIRDSAPLVGRRELLDEMLKAYLRAGSDDAAGFYLTGEAGIGKTRLAQALVEKIRLFPDFGAPLLTARAQKYRPAPFAAIVDMILGHLGLDQPASPGDSSRALEPFAGLPPQSRERFSRLACCKDPEDAEAGAIGALYDVFEAIVDARSGGIYPALVFVDDAPFLDRLSREFFQYYLKRGGPRPFFVLAGRDLPPELRKAFPALKAARLGPLERGDAESLARAHWPEAQPEAIARIVEAGMGNPLFIREYAAYARKRRDVSALPATVQTIFLTGLERYPAEWRDLAKRLSVFVHSFTAADARYVQDAIGGDGGAVEPALSRFLKDGLVVEKGGAYSFRADVYKKALYASLLNHNKRVLHGLIADLLLARERPDRIRLIYHLVRAERFSEAARAMQDDPNRTYNYELLPYIEVLLRRIKDDRKAKTRLLVTKAAILYNRGKIVESEAVLQRIMRGALARRDPNMLGYAYHQVCAYSAMTYAFQKAVFAGQKALYYYRKAEVSARSVQSVIRTMAQAQVMRNDLDEARRLVAQCEALPGGDVSDAYEAKAELLLMSGDYRGALATVGRCLESLPPERTASLFYAYDTRMRALWQLCDYRGIEAVADRLLALRPLSEKVLSEANAMCALSSLLSGRAEAARDRFVQAEFYAGQIRNEFARVDALGTLALCRYLAGDPRRAEAVALESLTLALRHSCYWPAFSLLMMLAESSAERGKEERARFFLVEASYFFTTGMLLPSKDLILYYWLASRLLDSSASARNEAVALRLFEEEKARIGDDDLVAVFLSTRSFGRVQRALEGVAGDDPRRLS